MKNVALEEWIGRQTTARDIVAEAPLRRLAALFDQDEPSPAALPPLGHWFFFLPEARQSQLGGDGHPHLGTELPDFGLPRRMWAGSRVTFEQSIPIGAEIERITEIAAIRRKEGSTGPLVFLTLRHDVRVDGRTAVFEEQDLVYREAATPGTGTFARTGDGDSLPARLRRVRNFDPIALFRFSALTFNGHRIHYDREYARQVEGYPGLVVHGPYQACCLMDLYRTAYPDHRVSRFSFRARAPLFDGEEATLGLNPRSNGGDLWLGPTGFGASLTATISIDQP
jgi:3-methylfumaryl-CoA hydratase